MKKEPKIYKRSMKEEVIKDFLRFEQEMLSKPSTFFPMFEAGFEGRSKLIWKEFIDWQNSGGKLRDFNFRDLKDDVVVWKIGNETFAQKIDKLAPFSKGQYKKGLQAVYSFMEDRPQYYKFRHMNGMFNPLRILLYKFLD